MLHYHSCAHMACPIDLVGRWWESDWEASARVPCGDADSALQLLSSGRQVAARQEERKASRCRKGEVQCGMKKWLACPYSLRTNKRDDQRTPVWCVSRHTARNARAGASTRLRAAAQGAPAAPSALPLARRVPSLLPVRPAPSLACHAERQQRATHNRRTLLPTHPKTHNFQHAPFLL